MGTVILCLGSNLGDRMRHLERALEELRKQIMLERISSVYETRPVGLEDQPWFLNLVCMGVTRLRPRATLEFALEVENALGRKREERFGPLSIDIDIIAYDDRVIRESDLEIPHPRMSQRGFVLEPLAEIAPEWKHPVEGRSVAEMLEGLTSEVVRVYSDPPPTSGPAPLL
jgi:2-amino-4-hydroxy-6-hydroxymethyldihydropteridine diphosphokinase